MAPPSDPSGDRSEGSSEDGPPVARDDAPPHGDPKRPGALPRWLARPSHAGWIVGVLALLMAVLAISSMTRKSLTYDELSYIPAGYSYWQTGDFRLNPEQPPLSKLIAGLPLHVLGPAQPVSGPAWSSGDQWRFGRQFFERPGVDVEWLVLAGRLPSVGLALLLLLGVYLFARHAYGKGAGLLAALLCAFSPNILAHARLANTDIAVACFTLWTVYLFYRFTVEPRLWRVLAMGGLLAAALLTKYSAAVLVVAMLLWAATLPFLRGTVAVAAGSRFAAQLRDSEKARALYLVGAVLVAFGTALLLMSIVYGTPAGLWQYVQRITAVYSYTPDDFHSYLHGEFAPHRHPHYFAVAFLVKTPLALLLLLGARIVTHILERRDSPGVTLMLASTMLGFFVLISWKALGIGVRYLLPVYPLLFVYVAGIWHSRLLEQARARIAAAALVAWFAISTLAAHPHYLPYFNEAAGGPDNGIAWLDDSNVDWGQDLIGLRECIARRQPNHVWVTTMTPYDPGIYGIRGSWVTVWEILRLLQQDTPPPGLYAVSVHVLNRALHQSPAHERFMRDLEPTVVVGHSLYVYAR